MKYCLLILIGLVSCDPYNPKIVYTAPGQQPDSEYCGAAEEHMQTLCKLDEKKNSYCCEVVKPTKKGKSYKQFCEEKQTQNVFLNPKCVASVSVCEAIDDCTNSR